jgi:hypothetical protein
MKPKYATLKANYYSSNELNPNYVDKKQLYAEIGYDIDVLIRQNSGYHNTCAARVSLALIKSGVYFSGRLKIKAGGHVGRAIEPGAKLLADQLSMTTVFGRPQIFKPVDAVTKLQGKKGVVFFWKITGYDGGHIDLIEPIDAVQVCNSACYFSCKEIWFWSLD